MRKKNHEEEDFPTFPALLFVVSVLWLLSDLGLIVFDIPWWPVILMILSLKMMVKFYHFHDYKKK